MSKDYQLSWNCPHFVVDEVVELGSDRRSLRTRQPIASANAVRVWVGYDYYIPQAGLFVPAQLHSTVSGPYDLVEGEDTFTISTSAGTATVVFGVSVRRRIQTDDVVREIQLQAQGIVFAENLNGHLVLSDTNALGDSSVVKVSGSAATSLGFGNPSVGNDRQWAARGKQLYPGWTLVVSPDERTSRYPQFVSPVRTNPVFQVSYSTTQSRCLRCGGTGQENDIRFDQSGQALMVEDENLLHQASLKMLLTARGSNPYHPEIGTNLSSLVGAKALGAIADEVSRDVRRALAQYQARQQAQARYQQVSFKERLYKVLSVRTVQSQEDPTVFAVDVVIQNASNEPIALTVAYATPDVIATIKSSNGFTER